MDKTKDSKIQNIVRLRKKAHSYFSTRSRVYKAFVKMEKLTYSDSVLKKKDKELIATGISVAINCESCMEWHISQALSAGASHQEILDAVDVGIEMSGGPGTVAARFAMEVLNHYKS